MARVQAKKQRRGFAAMTPEKQRAIAAMGGKAAAESGNAHKFTHDEAVKAGKKRARLKKRAREDGGDGGVEHGPKSKTSGDE